METTTINKKLSTQVKRALEAIPEEEIEAFLRNSHPELFEKRSNQEQAIGLLKKHNPLKTEFDFTKGIRKDRDSL